MNLLLAAPAWRCAQLAESRICNFQSRDAFGAAGVPVAHSDPAAVSDGPSSAAMTADQMLSDDELAGFVEFGADPDDVLAAQRSTLQAQHGEGQQEDGAGGRRSRRGRQGPGGRSGRQQQVPDELLPKVAIVGRPNVGKSGEWRSCQAKQATCRPWHGAAKRRQAGPRVSQWWPARRRRRPPYSSRVWARCRLLTLPLSSPLCVQRCSTASWASRWPSCMTTPVSPATGRSRC